MLTSTTDEENKQRLAVKAKLANAMVLTIVEDKFIRSYVRYIFIKILGLQSKNIVECINIDEAKKYLGEHTGNNMSCIVSNMAFRDGTTGADFLSFARSTYRSVRAPFVLIGDNARATVKYAFLVKHFSGHISQPFTPAIFIRMLLEIFTVRDRRRDKRELKNEALKNRPFNRLFEGDLKGAKK